MSDNALVQFDATQLPSTQLGSDEELLALSNSGGFIGRLQLYTKGTAVNKRLIGPGEYGIPGSGDDITGLGDSVDVLVCACRPKAIDMNDLKAILVSYDTKSDKFKSIMAKADQPNSKCMFGLSFLVIERTTGRFLEFFCGTKSTRKEAGVLLGFCPLSAADIEKKSKTTDVSNLKPHGPLAATLKSRLAENSKGSWHVPVVLPCSTPFNRLPTQEQLNEETIKFTNPKEDGVEKVEDAAKANRRAR
jgi:hypothetical protein